MINNIVTGIKQQGQLLFEAWKYLLLQERCRLCKRMIHPLVINMDFVSYGPPACYFIAQKQIISDVICQFCVPELASCRAVLNKHLLNQSEGATNKANQLIIGSGALFAEPLQGLIYRLKYDEDLLLAKDLALLMHGAWKLLAYENSELTNSFAISLVPVPLHARRLQERGFNQAEALCRHLADFLSCEVKLRALIRVRHTLSQQKLSKVARMKNVVGAFKPVNANIFFGKKVILIDDVATSGATLTECARAVLSGGAEAVYALTVAFVP